MRPPSKKLATRIGGPTRSCRARRDRAEARSDQVGGLDHGVFPRAPANPGAAQTQGNAAACLTRSADARMMATLTLLRRRSPCHAERQQSHPDREPRSRPRAPLHEERPGRSPTSASRRATTSPRTARRKSAPSGIGSWPGARRRSCAPSTSRRGAPSTSRASCARATGRTRKGTSARRPRCTRRRCSSSARAVPARAAALPSGGGARRRIALERAVDGRPAERRRNPVLIGRELPGTASATQRPFEPADQFVDARAGFGAEGLELDAHAGRLVSAGRKDAHDATARLDRRVAARQLEVQRDARVGGRRVLGLDEETALVDVARELGEERVDRRVGDAHDERCARRATPLDLRLVLAIALPFDRLGHGFPPFSAHGLIDHTREGP